MENKCFQGESLGLVFCCRDYRGEEVVLEGKRVDVFLVDRRGVVVREFSTEGGSLRVKGNVVMGRIPRTDELHGVYSVELRVTVEGAVLVDVLVGVRIYGCVIGKEVL